jgi:hypothetical protein
LYFIEEFNAENKSLAILGGLVVGLFIGILIGLSFYPIIFGPY